MKTFRYIFTMFQVLACFVMMVAASSQNEKEIFALYFLALTYLIQKSLEQSEP